MGTGGLLEHIPSPGAGLRAPVNAVNSGKVWQPVKYTMRKSIKLLAILLLVSLPTFPQDTEPKQDEDKASAGVEKAPAGKPAPSRPTLGPAPPPSLGGAKTSTTTSPRGLVRVKTIYVERMDNGLHEKLIEVLSKNRRITLVGDTKDADAILRGTCFDSRRLKMLRSEVYLNSVTGASIWQDSVRRPINPPKLDAAVAEAAAMIAAHLSESMVEAERR